MIIRIYVVKLESIQIGKSMLAKTLKDRYRIYEKIGKGGFGEVYCFN